MALTDLTRTKVHLVSLQGRVVRHPFGYELRTPSVPTYHYGTCLALEGPPQSIEEAEGWHHEVFGEEVGHRLVFWGGDAPSAELCAAAEQAGYEVGVSTALAMDTAPPASDVTGIRPLGIEDWSRVEALSRACNASEADDGDPGYRVFREGMRGLRRASVAGGAITWWGAFIDDELVGQCGLAVCDSVVGAGLGRFQEVEVHPAFRRRGVASRLVGAVARHGIGELGCRRLIIEADAEGPAVGLYTRLGFRRIEDEHSLSWSPSPIHVRAEGPSDLADLRAFARLATGDDAVAERLAGWRKEPGYRAWVADRDGTVLGHIALRGGGLASGESSLVLRPSAARRGVEEALRSHVAALAQE